MTANELADELQACFTKADWEHIDEAATMLRQQQAELTEAGHMISVLREYISDLEKGLESSINLNRAQNERK
jgi:hypothetical protein